MKALLLERNVARFAAARAASAFGPALGVGIGPLRLADVSPPELPGPGWHRVKPLLAGICGSDLSTLDGHASRYFEELVSFPFVPGHEIVGEIDAPQGSARRVVIQPALGCVARSVVPLCAACAQGRVGGCERLGFGHLEPGLQTGYCTSTGGGWSVSLVAHESQIHPVPDDMTDEAAVMVEPTACAVHAAMSARVAPGDTVGVLGAGTLGLVTVAALRSFSFPRTIMVSARYADQAALARDLGADMVVKPDELVRAVRRHTRSFSMGSQLTGGAEIVIDCAGTASSIAEALSVVKPRGKLVMLGMPGKVTVDLAPLWHREVALLGAYAYGREEVGDETVPTFELAFDLVTTARLERLVSAKYPIERFEEAVSHAANAGRRGATKVVFDLRARPLSREPERRGRKR